MPTRPCRRPELSLTLGLSLAAGACDLPTEAPILEQRWVVPVEDTRIPAGDFLPDGVTDGGTVFLLAVPGVTVRRTLAELCPPCAAANGATVPKPAFVATASFTQPLPDGILGAEFADAAVDVSIRNGFSFDPLRPGAARGTLEIVVSDGPGGPQVGRSVVDGVTRALPPGGSTTERIALSGTVRVGLHAQVILTSPAGDPTPLNGSDALVVTTPATSVPLGSATVDAAGTTVGVEPVTLDTGDLDDEVTDHIVEGALVLDIDNPFGVGAVGEAIIDYPGGSLRKALEIPDGVSTLRIGLTGDELRTFLGADGVVVRGTGTVPAPAPPILLVAGRHADVSATLDVTVRVGG